MLFDFTVYDQMEIVVANEDFKVFVKKELLRIPYAELPPVEKRIAFVSDTTEAFFNHFGEHMDSVNLYHLSNYIMLEDIKNPDVHKRHREEYSFLSPKQSTRRKGKEFSTLTDILDAISTRQMFQIAKVKRTVVADV